MEKNIRINLSGCLYFSRDSLLKICFKVTASIVTSQNCSDSMNPCLQFCSSDEKNKDELFKSFAKSDFAGLQKFEVQEEGKLINKKFNYSRNYGIYRGEPKCINKEITDFTRDHSSGYKYDTEVIGIL